MSNTLAQEDALRMLSAMCNQEILYSKVGSFRIDQSRESGFANCSDVGVDSFCSIEHRHELGTWCYRVVDHLGIPRDTVAYAFFYLDHFMLRFPRDKRQLELHLQLVTTSAIFLACKVHHFQSFDGKSNSLLSFLLSLARGKFTREKVEKMELMLLQSLSFYLHPPIPCWLVHVLVSALSVGDAFESIWPGPMLLQIKEEAIYLTELAVLEPELAHAKPSIIAAAALLNALIITHENPGGFCSLTGFFPGESELEFILGEMIPDFDINELSATRRALWSAHGRASSSESGGNQSVYTIAQLRKISSESPQSSVFPVDQVNS